MMNDELVQKCLEDPKWRITSGALYKIITKDDNDENDEGHVVNFIPNQNQREFIDAIWYRNVILKARQLGFTTLVATLWLDHALFNKNQRCGIIAQDKDAAEAIFRDKVKFAYENLPYPFRKMFPLKRDSASELLFAHNNSSIRVATSLRSGTIHRLHVSEMGKIGAKYPEKAKEIITGSIPSVPLRGITIIESTAEGASGYYHDLVMRSLDTMREGGVNGNPRNWRLHFFAWWQNDEYRMDPLHIPISAKDNEYFETVEAYWGIEIDEEQRAWYVATRDADYKESPELMWQEYPSTPEEAFQVSTEGVWLAKQMTELRKSGRLKTLPVEQSVSAMTFWDIGNTEGTAIWVVQRVGHEFRCIDFYEAWGEPYAHAVQWLQSLGLPFDTHYLPHDAEHVRQGQTVNKSPRQMLEELLPGARFEVVPRIENITWGIQQLRDMFPMIWIDETKCKEGVAHLDLYHKKWNARLGAWTDVPEKADGHSEAADALRQLGQAYAAGLLNITKRPSKRSSRNWRTA